MDNSDIGNLSVFEKGSGDFVVRDGLRNWGSTEGAARRAEAGSSTVNRIMPDDLEARIEAEGRNIKAVAKL